MIDELRSAETRLTTLLDSTSPAVTKVLRDYFRALELNNKESMMLATDTTMMRRAQGAALAHRDLVKMFDPQASSNEA